MRVTSWLIVVLPAPDGPTRATSSPGSARKETWCSTSLSGVASRLATASNDASETCGAIG